MILPGERERLSGHFSQHPTRINKSKSPVVTMGVLRLPASGYLDELGVTPLGQVPGAGGNQANGFISEIELDDTPLTLTSPRAQSYGIL